MNRGIHILGATKLLYLLVVSVLIIKYLIVEIYIVKKKKKTELKPK